MQLDHKSSIINVVNLYALAVDARRWALFDQVFTSDTEADFGPGIHWHGLASLKQSFAAIHAPFNSTQHITTNHNVTVIGDVAHCLSYVHGRFVREAPGGNMFESTGWYDDRLILTAAGWRISHRKCRSIWCGGNPKVMETVEGKKAEFKLYSLHGDADAGEMAYLRALVP